MNLRPVLILVAAVFASSVSAQTLSNYQAEVTAQSPTAYFKLDGSLESAVNGADVLTSFGAGGFIGDVFRNPTNSYFFVNNTDFLQTQSSLINGGGTANSNAIAKGSITVLFRALNGPNIGGQRFVFDATTTTGMGTSNHNALALYFENDTSTNNPPNALLLRFGDTTTTILEASNVAYNAWYYFALTYDEARKPNKAIWHIGPVGGVLATGMTTNADDAVAGEGTQLFIGNRAGFAGAYRNPGNGRIDEFAIWNRELSSLEISNQFSKLPQPAPPGATYQQVVTSQIPKYYFKLDGSLVESVGGTLMLSTNSDGGSFTSDFLGNPSSAFSFSKTNDALVITNDLINGGGPTQDTAANGVGTISLQFRMLNDVTNTGQRFIFSAPGQEVNATDDNQLALFLEGNSSSFFPNSLKLRVGNQTLGSTSSDTNNVIPIADATNLVPNAWYYFAMTYDESRNSSEVLYYFGPAGGTLRTGLVNPANNSVIGDNGPLVIGNSIFGGVIQDSAFRNPGNGFVDEFAIWHDELTPGEIAAQFAAMSATPAAPPKLNIALAGANVVLSWATNAAAGFNLETTTNLTTPFWSSGGAATVVGSNNVVTNAVTGDTKFYRLKK